MNRIFTIAIVGAVCILGLQLTSTVTAQAPGPIPSVWLQGGTPGTMQTGNFNVNGKGKAAQLEAIYSGPQFAIFAQATSTSGGSLGVVGISAAPSGAALYGDATSSTGLATGVFARSFSTSGTGVAGTAVATSGTTYGVKGLANSDAGYGVHGSSSFIGVYGEGSYAGVEGIAAPGNFGVVGVAAGNTSIGVYAESGGTNSIPIYSLATAGAAGVFNSYGNMGLSTWSSLASGTTYGLYSTASSPDGYAMYARNLASTGNAVGIYATSDSSNGRAIRAEAWGFFGGLPIGVDATSNTYYAVRGTSESSHGMFGQSTAGGLGIAGVWGEDLAFDGTGVVGYGQRTGVYGATTGGGNAGQFNGNLYANSASASIKAFVIDHPLDPANKYLYHSCVESNERMNTYKGRAILDANGEAWVKLPDYFDALNTSVEYQLTAIGKPNPNIYIASEVKNNRFQIGGGMPGSQVSWQVFGVRQDAYALAHPLEVEKNKNAEERGRYLNPVELGFSEDDGLPYDVAMRHAAKRTAMEPKPSFSRPPAALKMPTAPRPRRQ